MLTNAGSAVVEMKPEANSYLFEAGKELEDQYDMNDLGGLDEVRTDAMMHVNRAEAAMTQAYDLNIEAVEKGPGMAIVEGEENEISAEEQQDLADDAFDYLDTAVEELENGMALYDDLVSSVEEETDTRLSGVRAKLGAAEQVYADAIESISHDVAETKRGLAAPQEAFSEYSPIFDEGM